jgi:uncharacterized protein DUF222
MPPSAALAGVVEDLAGPDRRFPYATQDELEGLLDAQRKLKSRAAATELAVIRALIRRSPAPGRGPKTPGGLPSLWAEDLAHEIAPLLHISLQAADKQIAFAWELGARLPRTGQLLDDGAIEVPLAQAVIDELSVLDDEQAARAELKLAGKLPGMTPGKARRLAQRTAVTIDPEGARKRREQAEKDDARVEFYADHTGTYRMFAAGLPADQALKSDRNVNARARQYRKAALYPGATMDYLRAMALLDLTNEITLAQRTGMAHDEHAARTGCGGRTADTGGTADGASDTGAADGEGTGHDSRGDSDDDGSGDPGGDDDGSGGGPGDGGDSHHDDGDGGPGHVPSGNPGLPANVNLTLVLPTLQGLAERPGEAPGLGTIDPALSRILAAQAAANQHSNFCLTITTPEGWAIGHGCARPPRGNRKTRDGPRPPWSLTRLDGPGPPGGYGSWLLILPGGRELILDLHAVPLTGCDHQYETRAYRPGKLLRHLVEIRDGECTHPSCSHPAGQCDFEHAIPHDKGGPTCGCNAGARSRRCHRVKQMAGWRVTQPLPGWHQWRTPSGRTYTQGPKQYHT